jgi:hypothetical protein
MVDPTLTVFKDLILLNDLLRKPNPERLAPAVCGSNGTTTGFILPKYRSTSGILREFRNTWN